MLDMYGDTTRGQPWVQVKHWLCGIGLGMYTTGTVHPSVRRYSSTAHKYCIFTSRGVRLALGEGNELGIIRANRVW